MGEPNCRRVRQQFDGGPPGPPLEEGGQWTWMDREDMPSLEPPQSSSVEQWKRPEGFRGEHVQNACLDGQHPLSALPMHGQFLSCKSEASLSQPPLQLGYRPVMQALALSQNREPLDGGGNEGWKRRPRGIHFQLRMSLGVNLRGIAPGASRASSIDNAGLWALLPMFRIQVFSDLPQASGRSTGLLHLFLFSLN